MGQVAATLQQGGGKDVSVYPKSLTSHSSKWAVKFGHCAGILGEEEYSYIWFVIKKGI